MEMTKYHGAGNDFLMVDGRNGVTVDTAPEAISRLCDRHRGFGADGMIVLRDGDGYDFHMDYYKSDGSGGMMCGNGGRCTVAFAKDLGIAPSEGSKFVFSAADGRHEGEVLEDNGDEKYIRIKMIDVKGVELYPDGYFLNTGTRHFVRFVRNLDDFDVVGEGRRLRWDSRFAPQGTNVNFVEVGLSDIRIRTFEKGVEDETQACGTGIVASAMAAYVRGIRDSHYTVKTLRDTLAVDFTRVAGTEFSAVDVYLSGPAERIGTVNYCK